jgi:methionyl-tRNA formyltransferase
MRIVFMGTPEFSVPTLAEVAAAGHDVVAVYSQPPRPAGRGMAETKSPVQQFAEASGLTVHTPRTLKAVEAQDIFRGHNADAAVVVAYGLLLPQVVLDMPRLGCFNLHASLLPRWRGAAPIQRAIMAGDTATAAMVMRMEAGLDTGPVCLAEHMAIGPDMTAGELHDTLSVGGAGLIVRALAALERGSLIATPQPDAGVTYAAKIEKAEARIDFDRDATAVHNHIRGLSPHPGAWFEAEIDGKRERIKVLRSVVAAGSGAPAGITPGTVLDDALTIACQSGAIQFLSVQRAGKKAMAAGELLRGVKIGKGMRVG